MDSYDFKKIETKWRKYWINKKIYQAKDKVAGKKNFHNLVMFPYPSGNLHIGHWYNFTGADVFARFKRMSGFNVMSPIGFDAFGLPAENAAIKRGIHPKKWTYANIGTMTKQLESIGATYDWSRKIITADPEYYKWTQWIFLQLFKKGLAYKKKAPANWCPKCHTVLANEQVVDGKCERCQTEVVQRDIEQWLFRITKYAEQLLSGLEKVDWPEKTKTMQRNWIGKSEGTLIKFLISNSKFLNEDKEYVEVFTTRVDTIFSGTFLILAPEHAVVKIITTEEQKKEVERYIEATSKKTNIERTEIQKDKTGVFTGSFAINPATGEKMQIWISDFVLASYGTGAVFADAHDERDFEMAKKFNIPLRVSIRPNSDGLWEKVKKLEVCYSEDGVLVDSGEFDGLTSAEARPKITKWLEDNSGGKKTTQYRLRDWLVSRQRYWGAPIPIVYCEKCGIVPVAEKNLPVILPNVKDYLPTEEGRSPLAHSDKFVKTKCPKCGGKAERETDTMDTFVCSSWYYLRYADSRNSKKFADAKKIKAWLPVDMYVGGAEHSVLHLLYARFFTKFLKDAGHLNLDEPFTALRHQGIILGPDGQKMSKSRGNVIDPDALVAQYGSDVVRMYLCFMSEYSQGGPWNPTGILGVKRFLERVWKMRDRVVANTPRTVLGGLKETEIILHQTIKKVTEDVADFKFNTAISQMMILANKMDEGETIIKKDFCVLVQMLSPFAPHFAEELWSKLGNKKSIFNEKWPKYDAKKIKEDTVELAIQINGRVRDKMEVDAKMGQEEVEHLTFLRENVKKYIVDRRSVKKVIYVPGRLINIVV